MDLAAGWESQWTARTSIPAPSSSTLAAQGAKRAETRPSSVDEGRPGHRITAHFPTAEHAFTWLREPIAVVKAADPLAPATVLAATVEWRRSHLQRAYHPNPPNPSPAAK